MKDSICEIFEATGSAVLWRPAQDRFVEGDIVACQGKRSNRQFVIEFIAAIYTVHISRSKPFVFDRIDSKLDRIYS